MKLRMLPVWIILSMTVLCLSCGDDAATNVNGDPEYTRSTPEDLFQAFAYALETEDLALYEECLHDEFLFVFLPPDADSAGLPPDQPWWGKTEDVDAIGDLFAAAGVTRISCDMAVVTSWPTENGIGFRLEPDIKVTVEQPGAEEPLIMWVNSCWFDVEAVRDAYDEDKWVFREMTEELMERLAGQAATEPSTWGGIKSMFK